MNQLQQIFHHKCNTINDINEHLPDLKRYASQCSSALELGTRDETSLSAILLGLAESNGFHKELHSCAKQSYPQQKTLENIAQELQINLKHTFVPNTLQLDIPNGQKYDMIFIDSWHVFGQTKRELEKFSKITNKYIILHDTTIDAEIGESIRNGWDCEQQSQETGIPVDEIKKGIMPAITEFIQENNTQWRIHLKLDNQHGLTILSRISHDIKLAVVAFLNFETPFHSFFLHWIQFAQFTHQFYPNIRIYIITTTEKYPDISKLKKIQTKQHNRTLYQSPDYPFHLMIHRDENKFNAILDKTWSGFQYAIEDYQPDFILRSNACTAWNWNILLPFMKGLPRNNLYCGKLNTHIPGYKYISGAGILITPDIAQFLLSKTFDEYYRHDDLYIGHLILSSSNPIHLVEVEFLCDYTKLSDTNGFFHVRFHTSNDPIKRIFTDVLKFKRLLQYWYPQFDEIHYPLNQLSNIPYNPLSQNI